jgi:hypothetical protein
LQFYLSLLQLQQVLRTPHQLLFKSLAPSLGIKRHGYKMWPIAPRLMRHATGDARPETLTGLFPRRKNLAIEAAALKKAGRAVSL